MDNIICRGDVHGKAISAFSYKRHPWLRDCHDDAFIVCGDFGIPFGVAAPYYPHNGYKSDEYQLEWLQEKLDKNNNQLYVILGNHDDRIAVSRMPTTDENPSNLELRQMSFYGKIYPNIYIITEPCVLDIMGKICFMIPGGTSHDAEVILDPNSATFKQDLKYERKAKKHLWRIKDWEWWPDEVVDTSKSIGLARLIHEGQFNVNVDYVFSHEAPSMINKWFKRPGFPGRLLSTEGEKALKEVYNLLPSFKHWYHGHYHFTDEHLCGTLYGYDAEKPISCVYKTFVDCGTGEYLV